MAPPSTSTPRASVPELALVSTLEMVLPAVLLPRSASVLTPLVIVLSTLVRISAPLPLAWI